MDDTEFVHSVADVCGWSVCGVRFIDNAGSVNQVARVSTSDDELIVRFHRDPLRVNEFAVESWCSRAAARVGVPTPAVLAQAMLELRAEDLETARVRALAVQVPSPTPTSKWWLLLPPVFFVKRHRGRELAKDQWLDLMADEDFESMAQFSNKAAAWVMVGFGGLMIALKETYELIEGNEWSLIVFWILAAAMLVLSVSFGVSRMHWMDDQLGKRQTRAV